MASFAATSTPAAHRTDLPYGLLLIGHGTRSDAGAAEFFTLADHVARQAAGMAVEPCFLELRPPTIAEAWQRLVARGARHLHAAPVLLFAAGHAKRDIPAELARCAAATPEVTWDQSAPLQSHERIVELSRQRFREAAGRAEAFSPQRTAWILVGRGSLDGEATAAMQRFTEQAAAGLGVQRAETAFLAMAAPPLPEVLQSVAADPGISTVIVQPHLLFRGDLNDRLWPLVQQAARQSPARRWLLADHLGPDPAVAAALLDRWGLPFFSCSA